MTQDEIDRLNKARSGQLGQAPMPQGATTGDIGSNPMSKAPSQSDLYAAVSSVGEQSQPMQRSLMEHSAGGRQPGTTLFDAINAAKQRMVSPPSGPVDPKTGYVIPKYGPTQAAGAARFSPIGSAQAAEVPQAGQQSSNYVAPVGVPYGAIPSQNLMQMGSDPRMAPQGQAMASPPMMPLPAGAQNASMMGGPAAQYQTQRYEMPGGEVGYQSIAGTMIGMPSGQPGAGVDRFAPAYNPAGGTFTGVRGAAADMPGYDQLTNDQKIQANVAALNQQRAAIRDLNAVRKAKSYYGLPEGQRGRLPNDVADAMGVQRSAPRTGGRDVIGGTDWATAMQDYASGRVGSEGYGAVRNMLQNAQSEENDRARGARRKLGRRSKYGVEKDMTADTMRLIGNMANKEMGVNAALDKADIQATQSGLQKQADLLQREAAKRENRAYREEQDINKEQRKAASDEKKAAATSAARALTSGRKEIDKLLPVAKDDLGEINPESQANNIAAQSAYDRIMREFPGLRNRGGEVGRRIAQAFSSPPTKADLEALAVKELGAGADAAQVAGRVAEMREELESDQYALLAAEYAQ